MPFICLLLLLAALLALFLLYSPGKIRPFRDGEGKVVPGSVAQVVRRPIGGVLQGMVIKGKDDRNPVLLFLHGGPGSPEYCMAEPLEKAGLYDRFTVCWWEQRGAGMSFSQKTTVDTMNLQTFLSDTVEVTRYLSERFRQEKIYVCGHSFGSYLGMHAIHRHPELYRGYIGIGQVSDQLRSEQLAHAYLVEALRAKGKGPMVRKLLAHPIHGPEDLTPQYMMTLRTPNMNRLGIGLAHIPHGAWREVLSFLRCKAYTPGEKIGYIRGMLFTLKSPLWAEVLVEPLPAAIPVVSAPVTIIHGAYDYQTSHTLAREYFDGLVAPKKQFITFDESAHSPPFEEPERFVAVLRENVLG